MSQIVFLNSNKNKAAEIIRVVQENIDKRRNYQLVIASCYLAEEDKIQELIKFINKLSKYIKIASISFYIDARQVIKSKISVLTTNLLDILREQWEEDKVQFYVVDTPNLFHTKSLTLISEKEECGLCLIGSSNFSNAGIFAANGGNYESVIFTNSINDIKNFLESLKAIQKHIVKLEDYKQFKTDSYTFKYAVLKQGYFIHKWQMTLEQYFSTKYKLTDLGKKEISFGLFKEMGFTEDTETVSRQFLQFDELQKRNFVDTEKLSNLRRNGIETQLGHWVPKSLYDELDIQNSEKSFHDLLSSLVNFQIRENGGNFNADYQKLLNLEYVEQNKLQPTDFIADKLNKLKTDHVRLQRFLTKYEAFELPYDFSQKDEIEELYKTLAEVSNNAIKKNKSMKCILEAIENKNPHLINEG